MTPAVLREIIETAINNHPKECVFNDDPVNGALQYLKDRGPTVYDGNFQEQLIDLLVEAVQSQELYCPHEGIDRRGQR